MVAKVHGTTLRVFRYSHRFDCDDSFMLLIVYRLFYVNYASMKMFQKEKIIKDMGEIFIIYVYRIGK